MNNVSKNSILRYLQQIFKVRLEQTTDVPEALALISDRAYNVPSKLTCAIWLPERMNVRLELWNLNKKSKIIKYALEELYFNEVSLLISDSTLTGKDSLILLYICTDSNDTYTIPEIVSDWWQVAGNKTNMQVARCHLEDETYINICALQLSSCIGNL